MILMFWMPLILARAMCEPFAPAKKPVKRPED